MHVRTALGEILEDPFAGLQRNLRHDAPHGLDEVEVRLVEGELRVALEQCRGEGAKLGKNLDTGEPATDHDDRQQSLALRTSRERCCLVEVRQQLVTDPDSLFDRLHADRIVGDTGDREGA
ncbi:hypothetical protein DC31_08790 [Microbacterium sp. CH12i]|nr:hypothetical protein DC31_08790 [Microbacterium sp. CH12i]